MKKGRYLIKKYGNGPLYTYNGPVKIIQGDIIQNQVKVGLHNF